MPNVNLEGTWKFVSLEAVSSNGEVFYPYGENPFGRLTYSSDGRMFVLLMDPDRPSFTSNDPLSGTPEEVRAAFEGFDAYCGTYDIDGHQGIVTHHIEGGKFPNWVGTDQVRYFELSGNQLTLTALPIVLDGVEWTLKAVLIAI